MIVAALFVIVMFRANLTYWIGRGLLAGTRHSRLASFVSSSHYLRAQRWLARWGAPAVSVSFLTICVQTFVNLAAGAAEMPMRRYLPAVTVGCIAWAVIYGTVGFIGFAAVARLWAIHPAWVLALAVAVVGVAVAVVTPRRRRVASEPG